MYTTQHEIIGLVRSFEDCTLSRAQWTHSAHLTVALWYLIHEPLTAAEQIRYGIQRYNRLMALNQLLTVAITKPSRNSGFA